MERRGCNLGCIIAALGLVLSCCLLPYLISSAYSIGAVTLDSSATPEWLWGSWLSTLAGESEIWYVLLAEGPLCFTGTIALLIVLVGLVMAVSGLGSAQSYEVDQGAAYFREEEDWR